MALKRHMKTISNVTDKIIPLIQEWQKTSLRSCLSDHLFRCSSCQSKGRSREPQLKLFYCIISVSLDGRKDVFKSSRSENQKVPLIG